MNREGLGPGLEFRQTAGAVAGAAVDRPIGLTAGEHAANDGVRGSQANLLSRQRTDLDFSIGGGQGKPVPGGDGLGGVHPAAGEAE